MRPRRASGKQRSAGDRGIVPSSSGALAPLARSLDGAPRRPEVTKMKRCVLDGARLADAAAVYRELAAAFHFTDYFGGNADALWAVLGEYGGEPIAVIWRNAAQSAERLGPRFAEIVAVLQRAAAAERLTLELA